MRRFRNRWQDEFKKFCVSYRTSWHSNIVKVKLEEEKEKYCISVALGIALCLRCILCYTRSLRIDCASVQLEVRSELATLNACTLLLHRGCCIQWALFALGDSRPKMYGQTDKMYKCVFREQV